MKFWKLPAYQNPTMLSELKRRAFGVVILLVTLTIIGTAQSTKERFEKVMVFETKANYITSDYLGFIYLISDDQISKYDKAGKLIGSFSDKTLGSITSIDASNPLRILVFYNDFGKVLFLDDVLGPIGSSISLESIALDLSVLCCTSNNDGIWFYDTQGFQLKRMDRNLQLTHASGYINQITGFDINPNFLIEYNSYIYLNNPEMGILVFDVYGAYYKTIPIKGLERFQLSGDNIFYFQDSYIKSYNQKTFEEYNMQIPMDKDTPLSVRYEKQSRILGILKENKMELYNIQD
ncbi:MAG TPA: hypothetical protein EYN69_05710 [Flavobacteriales bacterium]|nr:hypothetical protein [Flavobacteriales bacterium]